MSMAASRLFAVHTDRRLRLLLLFHFFMKGDKQKLQNC